MTSSIYNGTVIHKRFKPKTHYFKYNVFSLFIDFLIYITVTAVELHQRRIDLSIYPQPIGLPNKGPSSGCGYVDKLVVGGEFLFFCGGTNAF